MYAITLKNNKKHKQTSLIDRKRIRSGILAQTTVARPSAIPIMTPAASRFEPIATCRLYLHLPKTHLSARLLRSQQRNCLLVLLAARTRSSRQGWPADWSIRAPPKRIFQHSFPFKLRGKASHSKSASTEQTLLVVAVLLTFCILARTTDAFAAIY